MEMATFYERIVTSRKVPVMQYPESLERPRQADKWPEKKFVTFIHDARP
jgi:hypothetical protein